MKTTPQYVLTDDYIAEAQRLAIAQNTTLRLMYQTWWVWWLPRVAIVGFMIFLFLNKLESSAALMGAFLVLSFCGEIFSRRTLAKARARTRMKGSTSEFSMDEQGVDILGAYGNAHLKWPAMLTPVIYPHGVLIKLSRASVSWLPDQGLIEGSPADVRQLLAENVKSAQLTISRNSECHIRFCGIGNVGFWVEPCRSGDR